MAIAAALDGRLLEAALYEIDVARQSLPPATLTLLAQEVVIRVARNLSVQLPADVQPNSAEIDSLCHALLSFDPKSATVMIEDLRQKGSSHEALCLSYLRVAAQRLGDWWEDDKVSFFQVTIAAGRIYAILRVLRIAQPALLPDDRKAAIFASVPGENHTLGITMAADLARERGWDIELLVGHVHTELVEIITQRQALVIGLSASGKRSLPALTRLIVALRISNPGCRILVCGQIVEAGLSLVGLTGADAVAHDFQGAIDALDRLLQMPIVTVV